MTEGLVFDDTIPEKKQDTTEESDNIAISGKHYSGDGYVRGFKNDGSSYVVFEIDAPSNQHYDLSFSIASDKAVNCRVSVNDKETAAFSTVKDSEFTLITLYGVFLTKGKTSIELRALDGDMKLDYLKLSNNTSLSAIKYDADSNLSNKEAGESAKELMSFLSENYGKYTITGQYASDETNKELDLIYQTTGKYPVIRFSAMHNSGSSIDSTFKGIDA
jgi:mannan endo-1,4-beta-mannosidase